MHYTSQYIHKTDDLNLSIRTHITDLTWLFPIKFVGFSLYLLLFLELYIIH